MEKEIKVEGLLILQNNYFTFDSKKLIYRQKSSSAMGTKDAPT